MLFESEHDFQGFMLHHDQINLPLLLFGILFNIELAVYIYI